MFVAAAAALTPTQLLLNLTHDVDDGSMVVPVRFGPFGHCFQLRKFTVNVWQPPPFCVELTRDGGAQVTFLRTVSSAMCS
jgi:hypothetical protein